MRLKSVTGFAFATIYLLVFAGAYYAYWRQAGQFLADLPVTVVAMPYLYFTRALTSGQYSFSAEMTVHVISAAVFCGLLAYVVGWFVEAVVRGLFRLARSRQR